MEKNMVKNMVKNMEKHGKNMEKHGKTTPSSLFAVLSSSLFASRNTVFRVFTGFPWASGTVIGKDTLHAIVLRPRSATKNHQLLVTLW